MAILYLDTSALVKLYVQEDGTAQMLELAHPDAGNRLVILSLARVELHAAVRRRARLGDIDVPLVGEIFDAFSEHFLNVFQIQAVNETVLEEAIGAIDRHNLREYDAMQLAGGLTLKATIGDEDDLRFVCADNSLLASAGVDGLSVIDPTETAP